MSAYERNRIVQAIQESPYAREFLRAVWADIRNARRCIDSGETERAQSKLACAESNLSQLLGKEWEES
jgi:hypothetical protein